MTGRSDADWFGVSKGQWFAPDGSPIETLEEWHELFKARTENTSNDSWWRRRTVISDEVEVSTVWLGLNHRLFGEGPPLIWETMIFGGEHDNDYWRYSSRQEALDDHERIVRALREGRDPEAT